VSGTAAPRDSDEIPVPAPEHGYPAPAKLNLMLRVVGRRDDGYHQLQTIFRFIDFGDEVRLRVREDGMIRRVREIPGVAEADDLTVRAARLLKTATGSTLGAGIEVDKRVPMGAGLGGGSSDAATVLLALNHLWGTGLPRGELQALGLQLGADVPVFIGGENALGEGVGEVLTPIVLPPAWYVVLIPPVSVRTAAVFSHRDLKRDSKMIKIQGFSAVELQAYAVNDLQELVCRLYPEVSRHLAWLGQFGPALMTGSGAAVFASFETEAAARNVLSQRPSDTSGFMVRGLDRHPLRDLARD
jgi:4-diphosphocytidyl-2-C-methyl-D-erythritol kinase